MNSPGMTLKILLPSEVFATLEGVTRIVAETHQGSFGLLPRRLDCVAALVPGILTYSTEAGKTGSGDEVNKVNEVYVAVDEGVLVKAGSDVFVSVRGAFQDTDLSKLHEAVKQQFLSRSAEDESVRQALAKMESGLVRSLIGFHQNRNL